MAALRRQALRDTDALEDDLRPEQQQLRCENIRKLSGTHRGR